MHQTKSLTYDDFALAPWALSEGLELIVMCEAAVHGQRVEACPCLALQVAPVLMKQPNTLVDLFHASQKDENVAEALISVDLDHGVHAGLDIIRAAVLEVEDVD